MSPSLEIRSFPFLRIILNFVSGKDIESYLIQRENLPYEPTERTEMTKLEPQLTIMRYEQEQEFYSSAHITALNTKLGELFVCHCPFTTITTTALKTQLEYTNLGH